LALETIVLFLTPAVNYKFRVRALNIYGWGAFSEETTLYTSGVPLGPTSITMQTVNLNVKISWSLPFDNYMPITGYRLEVRDSLGVSYNEISQYCDGTKPQIVTERFCEIPMAQFRQPPHSLVLNQEIVVRIQARNIRGWGEYALSSNGIRVQSEPDAMDVPYRDYFTNNK
jgi:hypothetical protein